MMTDTPEEVRQARLTGERAEFFAHDTVYVDTIFANGESPLKHARNVKLVDCAFQWKYPLWYAKDVTARGCTWFEMGRAGVWCTNDIDGVTNPLSGVIRADHIGELTLDPGRIDPSRTVIDTREGLVMSDIAAAPTVAPSFA